MVYILCLCVLDDGDALGVVLMVGFVRWYLFIFFIKCQSPIEKEPKRENLSVNRVFIIERFRETV